MMEPCIPSLPLEIQNAVLDACVRLDTCKTHEEARLECESLSTIAMSSKNCATEILYAVERAANDTETRNVPVMMEMLQLLETLEDWVGGSDARRCKTC